MLAPVSTAKWLCLTYITQVNSRLASLRLAPHPLPIPFLTFRSPPSTKATQYARRRLIMAPSMSSLAHRSQRRPASSQTSQISSAPPLAPTYFETHPADILNAPLMRSIPLPRDDECDAAQARALRSGAPYGAYDQPLPLPLPSGPTGHYGGVSTPRIVYAPNGQPMLFVDGYTPEQLYGFQQQHAFASGKYISSTCASSAAYSTRSYEQRATTGAFTNRLIFPYSLGQHTFMFTPAPVPGQYHATLIPSTMTPTPPPQQTTSQTAIPIIASPKPVRHGSSSSHHGSPNTSATKSPLTPASTPTPPFAPQPVAITSPPRPNNEIRVRHDPAHRHATRPET
jgi:hypothetical protein